MWKCPILVGDSLSSGIAELGLGIDWERTRRAGWLLLMLGLSFSLAPPDQILSKEKSPITEIDIHACFLFFSKKLHSCMFDIVCWTNQPSLSIDRFHYTIGHEELNPWEWVSWARSPRSNQQPP